jgi:hypothetical protein
MKRDNIIFWASTIIIFLIQGVMPALTSHTEMAKEGIRHLGYPEYFGVMLMVFKVLGAIAIIIPRVPDRVKEWAYAGQAFDIIAAFISIWAVDGFNINLLIPLIVMAILIVSYIYFRKRVKSKMAI